MLNCHLLLAMFKVNLRAMIMIIYEKVYLKGKRLDYEMFSTFFTDIMKDDDIERLCLTHKVD